MQHMYSLISADEVKQFSLQYIYVRNCVFQPDFEDFVTFMTGGPSHILIVSKPKEVTDAVPQWKELSESAEYVSGEPQPEKPNR